MNEIPARGLPPRIYMPLILAILVIFGIPIGAFLAKGFGTEGSAIGTTGDHNAPPPEVAKVLAELRLRVAKNPRDVEAYESLAGLEVDIGKTRAAAQYYAQAVAIAPRDAQLRSQYITTLSDLGELQNALAQSNLLLRENPKNPDGYFERGVINERLGMRVAAAADYRHFLQYAPASDPRRAQIAGHSGS